VHTVIETNVFLRDVREVGMSDAEREAIGVALSKRPDAGDLLRDTGGARKVRFAGRGKGKSGGYRVVTYYAGAELPVFLLAVISKGERASLSRAEQNALKLELSNLKDEYLAAAAQKLTQMRRRSR
jgi:hypothetical protein